MWMLIRRWMPTTAQWIRLDSAASHFCWRQQLIHRLDSNRVKKKKKHLFNERLSINHSELLSSQKIFDVITFILLNILWIPFSIQGTSRKGEKTRYPRYLKHISFIMSYGLRNLQSRNGFVAEKSMCTQPEETDW